VPTGVETISDECRRDDTAASRRHPEVTWTATDLADVRPALRDAFCFHYRYGTPILGRTIAECLSGSRSLLKDYIRLVIAEVNGTLVMREKVLTARAMEAVKQLRNADIAFTLTSVRRPLGMKMLIDALALTEPIAAFNGGLLVHSDLSVMTQSFLTADIAAKLIGTIARHGLDCPGPGASS